MNTAWQAAGWPVARLIDIATLCSGGTPSRKRSEFFSGDIPWLTGQDIPEGRVADISAGRESVTEEGIKGSATRVVPANTVLVTTRVSVGKTAVTTCPLCFSQDVTGVILHSPDNTLPHFIAYFLLSQRRNLLQKNQGSTIAGITRDSLALERIPLPPISEQRRIVKILQEAEEIRRLKYAAEMKSAEIIPSIFRELFQKQKSANKWPEVKIAQIAAKSDNAIRTGPFGSQLLHSEFVSEGIPVIGIDNAVQNRFVWAEKRFITPAKYSGLKRFRVFSDDVIVTIMGTVGRVAIAPANLPESISTKHVCVITLDKSQALPIFLWASLLYDPFVRAQTTVVGKGAVMEGWNSTIIKSLKLKLPPLPLQLEFARIVRSVLAADDVLPVANNGSIALNSSLLSHAFTGQLTQNWRERHQPQLEQEAQERDAALQAAGATITRPVRAEAVEARYTRRSDGAYAELTREQHAVLEAIPRGDGETHRWFSIEELAKSLPSPLHGNQQAIASHLAVLAARGLVIAASLEQTTPDTGEIVYGNAYRLPLDAPVIGDRARQSQMERIAAQLAKGPSL